MSAWRKALWLVVSLACYVSAQPAYTPPNCIPIYQAGVRTGAMCRELLSSEFTVSCTASGHCTKGLASTVTQLGSCIGESGDFCSTVDFSTALVPEMTCSSSSGGDCTWQSTSNATKGQFNFDSKAFIDGTTGGIGINVSSLRSQSVFNASADTATNLFLESYSSTAGAAPQFYLLRGRGTGASKSSPNSGDAIGALYAAPYDSTYNGALPAAGFNFVASENASASVHGTYVQMYATATGSLVFYEAIRLQDKRVAVNLAAAPQATMHVTEGTVGNEVLRIESVATNDDPALRVFQKRATAAASGTTNIDFDLTTAAPSVSRAPCGSSKVCSVQADIVCHCTSGSSCTSNQGGANRTVWVVKNNGGTISQIGATGSGNVLNAVDSSLTSITFSVSSPNVRLAVVVPANYNHTCHVTYQVSDVGT